MLGRRLSVGIILTLFFACTSFIFWSQEARSIEDEALGAEQRYPNRTSTSESDEDILKNFGKTMISQAPDSVKNGSNLDKARFLFGAYTDALAKKDIVNNDGSITRVLVFIGNLRKLKLDPGTWTCGDHTVNLENIFKGGGLPVADIGRIEADSEGRIPAPNSGHGALVLVDKGRLYVFDAWMHAVMNGMIRGFNHGASSQWNGMPVGRWQTEVNARGYSRFTTNNGMTYEKNVDDSLKTLIDRNLQASANNERKAEKATTKDTMGTGVWELKKIEPVPIPASQSNCFPGRSLDLGDGMAVFTQGYAPCGGAVEKPGKSTSTITWKIPRTLTPGKSLKVSFSTATKSDPVPLFGGTSTVLYFNSQSAVGVVEHRGRLDDPKLAVPIENKEFEVPAVPNGKIGDKITMWVNVQGESGGGDVFYHYEMTSGKQSGDDPGPQPPGPQPSSLGPQEPVLTQNVPYSGEARETKGPRAGRAYPFKLKITRIDPASKMFTGELHWNSLDCIHRVEGQMKNNTVTFTEVAAIKAGAAHLNVRYELSKGPNGFTGTYSDPTDNSAGSMTIHDLAKTPPLQGTVPPSTSSVTGAGSSGNKSFQPSEQPSLDFSRPDRLVSRGQYGIFQLQPPGMTLHGKHFSQYYLQHPGTAGPTELHYSLKGKARRLTAWVGIDQSMNPKDPIGNIASVRVSAKGDGRALWESGLVTIGTPPLQVDLDLSGIQELVLTVNDGGDGISHDWLVWADPVLK